MKIQLDGPVDQLDRLRTMLGLPDPVNHYPDNAEEGHLEGEISELGIDSMMIAADAARLRLTTLDEAGLYQVPGDGATLDIDSVDTDRLKGVLKQFADIRMFKVEKGEETPRMASLLFKEFSLGVIRTVLAFGYNKIAGELVPFSHGLQEGIDPGFRESASNRNASGCLDYAVDKSE